MPIGPSATVMVAAVVSITTGRGERRPREGLVPPTPPHPHTLTFTHPPFISPYLLSLFNPQSFPYLTFFPSPVRLLFATKRHQRVDPGGAASRDVTSRGSDTQKGRDHEEISPRIGGADAKEQARHHAAGRQAGGHSEDDTDGHQPHPIPHDQPHHLPGAAPRAIRRPISLVRRPTAYAEGRTGPMLTRPIARAPNAIETSASRRSCTIVRSRRVAVVSNSTVSAGFSEAMPLGRACLSVPVMPPS